ncbi:hypothetical protein LCGC14_1988600, partial [marine sediment metagenome]
ALENLGLLESSDGEEPPDGEPGTGNQEPGTGNRESVTGDQ